MPVSYVIGSELILIVIAGAVTDRELLEAQHRMFDDHDFRGDLPRLVDASGVTEMKVSAAIVRHVSLCAYDRGMRRAAMVADTGPVLYGLMRMYAEYAGDAVVEIFRTFEDAQAWLVSGKSVWQGGFEVSGAG